jgi:thioredoxin-dependent peroxiredoxin
MSQLTIGKKAPAFTALDEQGARVKLSDFAGHWVVLYFYPRDDTPGCTVEACEFTKGLAAFAKLRAKVLGCSTDSPEKHRNFIAKHGLKIKLLSDPDHKVLEKYGAWGEKSLYGKVTVGTIRSTVLIDPQGKVAHHWAKVKAAGHAEQVRAKLAELMG